MERQAGAAERDGLQGAKSSNSRSYCEYLQRRRPPETADAHGAVICAEFVQRIPRVKHKQESPTDRASWPARRA
ncbi:hypothetical protein CBY09_17040 [Acidovorax kalamii]|uniref:Uncharacterized protein n=1 Tax=Acidovorax kalamii TaxID=2004485 RepID=A0A235EHU0_9BURK|nr:hypothetical protein CBY09_17040 [Acidovorax kalamii]